MKSPRTSQRTVPSTSKQEQKPNENLRLNQFAENAEKTLTEIKTEFHNFLTSTNEYTSKLNEKLNQPLKTYRSVSVQFLEVDERNDEEKPKDILTKQLNQENSCQCDIGLNVSNNKRVESEEKFVQINQNQTFDIIKEDRFTQCEQEINRKEVSTNTETFLVIEPSSKNSKERANLVQQAMPRVNIPATLVIQKTLDLEIKPCSKGCKNIKPNTVYKEFKHANTSENEKEGVIAKTDNTTKKTVSIQNISYPDEFQGKNADWPDVASDELDAIRRASAKTGNHQSYRPTGDVSHNLEKAAERNLQNRTVKNIVKLPEQNEKLLKLDVNQIDVKETSIIPDEASDMHVLEIIEDGTPLDDIVSKSMIAFHRESVNSTDSMKCIEQEDIMDIIKDGKVDKIHSLRKFGQANKGKKESMRFKSTNFQEFDELLKSKIELVEYPPSLKMSTSFENMSRKESEASASRKSNTSSKIVNSNREGTNDFKGAPKQYVTAMKRDCEMTKGNDKLTISSEPKTDNLKNVKEASVLIETSEDSFVFGRDVAIQCCLNKYVEDPNILVDVTLKCHDDCPKQALDVKTTQMSPKITQMSKAIQTSSSTSLALMFNEKLIEKIKTLPQDTKDIRTEDDQLLENFDKNIDGYKMTSKYEKVNQKKKRGNRKFDDKVLQPIKFNCFNENNQQNRGKDSIKLRECNQTKPIAISLDTSLGSAYESYSEGEIKCHCTTSIGEIHSCKYNQSIKSNVQYLKNHPDEFMQYEHADNNVKVIRKRIVNDNWHTYYLTSSSSSP